MDLFDGLFCWTFLLDFFVGLFCWTILLAFLSDFFSCGSNSGNGSVGWLVGKNDFIKYHHKT